MAEGSTAAHLERGIGFWGALSTNVLNMVGVGPFLTIPLALAAMGGPQAMLGWIAGAVLALCDGMVWAELGSRFPDSGGPYHFLREAFGPRSFGRVMAFLFLWQSLVVGPISIASGAVGLAVYSTVIHPLTTGQQKLLAVAVCLVNLAVLYRPVRSISALSVVVTTAVLLTCGWIIVSGALHFHPAMAFDFPEGAFHLTKAFWMGLGSALLIATYDYGGYGNVCLVGGEVQDARRNIPKAVVYSILLVAALYLMMNVAILGVVPWREGQHATAIVADFMRAAQGSRAAKVVSLLILIASWGSTYVLLLGYSRIPFTAAQDGHFPRVFARVHAKGHFPTASLVFIGVGSALMCLFSLQTLISAMIVVQTIFQFAAQCVAVVLLRSKEPRRSDVFRMPLYPLPAMVALIGWLCILATSEKRFLLLGVLLAVAGVGCYMMQASATREWPFRRV